MPIDKTYKKFIIDSCSLIYLGKIKFLGEASKITKLLTINAVKSEILQGQKEDLSALKSLFDSGTIKIIEPASNNIQIFRPKKLSDVDFTLIRLSIEHNIPLITEDGGIAEYCLNENIKFFNLPLFIVNCYKLSAIDINIAYDLIENVFKIGRYSKEIKNYVLEKLD